MFKVGLVPKETTGEVVLNQLKVNAPIPFTLAIPPSTLAVNVAFPPTQIEGLLTVTLTTGSATTVIS